MAWQAWGPDPPGPPDASVNRGRHPGRPERPARAGAAQLVKEGFGVKIEGGTEVASRGPTGRSATPPV